MGVVWNAQDASLDRNVAIKVLPELLSHDAARQARFQREAAGSSKGGRHREALANG